MQTELERKLAQALDAGIFTIDEILVINQLVYDNSLNPAAPQQLIDVREKLVHSD